MNWKIWSNIVWITLTLIVIGFELAGLFRLGPWRSLSETIWFDENHFWPLYLIVGGFVQGLLLHFSPTRTNFWESMGIGFVLVAVAYCVAAFVWPK